MMSPEHLRGLGERADIAIGGGPASDAEYLYRPGELLVRTEEEALVSELTRLGFAPGERVGDVQVYTGGPAGQPIDELLPALRTGRAASTTISPNHVFFTCPGRVGAADYPVATDRTFAPNRARPAAGLLVGVIDTGIVEQDGRPHPWLEGHVEYEPSDVERPPAEPRLLGEYFGHGTFVSSLVLREAPAATVRMLGVMDAGFEDETAIAKAIVRLGEQPDIDLINLSIAGYTEDESVPLTIKRALRTLDERVVVVIAVGNHGSNALSYPAAIPEDEVAARLIAVGAADENRILPAGASPPRAPFSGYGGHVDAYAHGVQVPGTYCVFTESGGDLDKNRPAQRFTGYARWSGTSFATATVTGRIARTKQDRGISAREAAELVLDEAVIHLPLPEGGVLPYVRGVSSTWPDIQRPAPTG